jgi:hypothetical protein
MKLPEGFASWVNTILLIAGLAGFAYEWGGVKQLLFDNYEQKYEVTKHVIVADTILNHVDKAIEAKSKNEMHAMESRRMRDSLLKAQADVSLRNAIQIEKLIKNQDSVMVWWRKYNQSANDGN